MNLKRPMLLAMLAAAAQLSFAAGEKPLIDNSASPNMPIKTIGLSDCRWDGGFWGDRTELCSEVMIPHIWSLVDDPEISHIFENFRIAAGEREGGFKGFLFGDGDFYKILEAMSCDYAMRGDEKLDKLMDEIIAVIGKAQMEDGYITTGKSIQGGTMMNFDHTYGGKLKKQKVFVADRDHEFYNFGHLFTAGCVHYRATGKRNLLDIAIKAADHLYDLFIEPSPEAAALHWNAPHFMGLVELYRTTGDERYIKLTETFLNMLGTTDVSVSGRGLEHSQKRIPFREETHAVGHAVHANYLYCGITDYAAEVDDKALDKSLNLIWEEMAGKKMYVTGALGSHSRFPSYEQLVGECYGDVYDLPNSRAYGETCANISNVMWSWRMFLASGQAKYMDVAELALYNSVLSGISLDGKLYYYRNPTRYTDGADVQHFSTQKERSEYLNCFCCPPNVVRTVAQVNSYAYSLSDKGVWVNIYGDNSLNSKLLDGTSIKLEQESRYTWDGDIKLEIESLSSPKEFSLMLRIPEWADGAKLKINEKSVAAELTPGTYYDCRRVWSEGDRVELELPMEVKLVQGHPLLEDVIGQVAIKRGPIVYCLESIDLPEGAEIGDISIPTNAKFKVEYKDDLLEGVTLLSA
ncbi:MAG: beta-L-arabinofuranosidase domain-containing protein, partial [Rikenellaceae bacterium]